MRYRRTTVNAHYDPTQPHHRPDGFRNRDPAFQVRSLADVLRWKRHASRNGLPPPPQTPTPRVAPDLPFLRANAVAGAAMQPAVNWIGHATVLAQLGGITLLTDPIFSERASPLPFAGPRRHLPPGISVRELPRTDVVVVSHNLREHVAERQRPEAGGGFDIALLPIGAYEPRWFMTPQHVNVAEAVKIHCDLGAKRSLGVHWGTFELTNEPLDEPPRMLVQEARSAGLAQEDFFVLAVGETRRIAPR